MTDIWTRLTDHRKAQGDLRIEALFNADPGRAGALATAADGLVLDWSKTSIDATARDLLIELAAPVAERREAMAQGLDHIENRAAVDARVRSDVAQGRPAAEAVANPPGRAPKARKTKGNPETARAVQRAGQSR